MSKPELKWKLEIHEPSEDSFGRTASVMGMRAGYIIELVHIADPKPHELISLRALIRAANRKP